MVLSVCIDFQPPPGLGLLRLCHLEQTLLLPGLVEMWTILSNCSRISGYGGLSHRRFHCDMVTA